MKRARLAAKTVLLTTFVGVFFLLGASADALATIVLGSDLQVAPTADCSLYSECTLTTLAQPGDAAYPIEAPVAGTISSFTIRHGSSSIADPEVRLVVLRPVGQDGSGDEQFEVVGASNPPTPLDVDAATEYFPNSDADPLSIEAGDHIGV
jgi:hypothetical protein